jgi:Protein of unknown function (DUF3987)/VirE N-terminal domain
MENATIFKNHFEPLENKSIELICQEIQTGKYKAPIEQIRTLTAEGKPKDQINNLKKKLLAFTPSATFEGKRKPEHLESYSGFICLDFDNLSPTELETGFKHISEEPYTAYCFISPSGNGLKVLVQVNSNEKLHTQAYLQVQAYYEYLTNLTIDNSGKDINRLCYMSYDPNLFANPKNNKFEVKAIATHKIKTQSPNPEVLPKSESSNEDYLLFKKQIDFTNRNATYIEGSRNKYLFQLASNCNRVGLKETVVLSFCTQDFDLDRTEIVKTVNSAFKNLDEHGKYTAKTVAEYEEIEIDYLQNTPFIPDEIFDKLPEILRKGCEVFLDKRKRDVFLTSSIGVLSGCLPGVTGVYNQERVYPHLFAFIIAPAASGKGVMKNAQRIAEQYHKRIIESSKAALERYNMELNQYKSNDNKTIEEPPIKPPFRLLFTPANISTAKFIEQLRDNDGSGIIFETEADTMGGNRKQDWGDCSAELRLAFHHERITFSRKTNNEYIEIEEPRVALILSGTPSQTLGIISSAEDGLFSRFIFYVFKGSGDWTDPSPKDNQVTHNYYFDALGTKVLDLVNFLDTTSTIINLTKEQWEDFNQDFKKKLSNIKIFTSEDALSIVYRLGLICYRICMILTAMRKFENGEYKKEYTCTDQDYGIAKKLVNTFIGHSTLIYNNLPNTTHGKAFKSGDTFMKLFDKLQMTFKRQEAIDNGAKMGICNRSVDSFLRNGLGKIITKVKSGLYQKL